MGANNGSIQFGNIPVGSGGSGGAVTASEGLTAVANNVTLGGNATVQRQITFDPGAGLLLGQALTGNNLNFAIDTGLTVDTRIPTGQSTRYEFSGTGLNMHGSGADFLRYYSTFPSGGSLQWEIGSTAPYTFSINNVNAAGNSLFNNAYSDGTFDFKLEGNREMMLVVPESIGAYTSGVWCPGEGGNANGGIIMGVQSALLHNINSETTDLLSFATSTAEMQMDDYTGRISVRQYVLLSDGLKCQSDANDTFNFISHVSSPGQTFQTGQYLNISVNGTPYKVALCV